MVAQGVEALEHEGVDASARSVRAAADMRYVGQHHEVTVEVALTDLDGEAGARRIESAFHARHESLYGFSSPGREMEVIGLRATVLGRREAPDLELASASQKGSSQKGLRRAWLPGGCSFAEVEVHDGGRLATGATLAGPILVERTTTTVLVPEGFDLSVDKLGSFVLRKARSSEVVA
jgi:N-methylhydantoinase A